MSLEIDDLFWFMHSRVFGSSAFQMLSESMCWIVGVTRIVGSVLAEDNIDIICDFFSHCSHDSPVIS